MKKKTVKKIFAAVLSGTLAVSLAACGKSGAEVLAKTESIDVTIDRIKLGEDYTDIQADLKFLTHKTDVIDTTFQGYITEFQKLYPNINIEYEGITNYADDIITRLSTGDWGDICMVPVTVDKDDLSGYFTSFGTKDQLSAIYEDNMLNNFAYQDQVYGIPSMANMQGVVYNKAVFEKAGVTKIPATPDEFIDALKAIKENTDVVAPLYTNFAAGWTMTAWDANIDGGATGDPDFASEGLTKGENPFADRGDGTGPYAVYRTCQSAGWKL